VDKNFEELGNMHIYFTSERDCVNQCVMVWRRQFKAMFSKADAIDSTSVDQKHTENCAQFQLSISDKQYSCLSGTCWVLGKEIGFLSQMEFIGRSSC
jgi:hypothetical protein